MYCLIFLHWSRYSKQHVYTSMLLAMTQNQMQFSNQSVWITTTDHYSPIGSFCNIHPLTGKKPCVKETIVYLYSEITVSAVARDSVKKCIHNFGSSCDQVKIKVKIRYSLASTKNRKS